MVGTNLDEATTVLSGRACKHWWNPSIENISALLLHSFNLRSSNKATASKCYLVEITHRIPDGPCIKKWSTVKLFQGLVFETQTSNTGKLQKIRLPPWMHCSWVNSGSTSTHMLCAYISFTSLCLPVDWTCYSTDRPCWIESLFYAVDQQPKISLSGLYRDLVGYSCHLCAMLSLT